MGILACLKAGFEIVSGHPTLMIIPIVLDVFLWLGPRLSLAPIFEGLALFLEGEAAQSLLLTFPGGTQGVSELRQLFEILGDYDFFSMLSLPIPFLGVPVLMPGYFSTEHLFGPRWIIPLGSPLQVLGVAIVLLVVGLGLNTLYLQMVGRTVIEETESVLPGPGSFFGLESRLVQFLWVLLAELLCLPLFVFFYNFLAVFNQELAEFMLLGGYFFGCFAVMHLLFVVPGVVQVRRHLLAALRESVLLTRADFFYVVLLALLIFFIRRMSNSIWSMSDPTTWLMILGIAGHAFVDTALMAAIFVFYQERLSYIKMLQRIVAAQNASGVLLPEGKLDTHN